MIYGDSPIKNSYYRDALGLNSYVPNIAAIMQSGNLYACCGNNPIMYVDPTGEAWWHWAIAATVVVVAAVAVVATCGGATPALVALMSVSYGFTATTLTSTVVASAFIGSSLVFAYIALDAATSSKSMKEFNEKGNWGTVAFTVGGLLVGGANGYTLYKSSFQIAGKGSTGRVEANNAKEVNAMKQIMTDPLKRPALECLRWLGQNGAKC